MLALTTKMIAEENVLREWPISDAATSSISRDDVVGLVETHGHDAGVVGFSAVSAHAGSVSIEDGRVDWIFCCASPVPVLFVELVS